MSGIKFRSITITPNLVTLDGTVQGWRVRGDEGLSGMASVHAGELIYGSSEDCQAVEEAVATISDILNRRLRERMEQ